MINKHKKILIYLILCFLFIMPVTASAASRLTNYTEVDGTTEIITDDVEITSVRFNNYADTSTQAFGLSGSVSNNRTTDITIAGTAYYYSGTFSTIATTYLEQDVAAGETIAYNQMSGLSELASGYEADDIVFFQLEIEITDLESDPGDQLTPSQNSRYHDEGYVLDRYHVQINVNEDNTFDITETITAWFHEPRHGIFRKIPLRNKVSRLDGTSSQNVAVASDITVDHEFSKSTKNNVCEIKIGSAARTITGEETYVISYHYNIGRDPVKDYDELYYNIIGNEWDTAIGNITFEVNMPKEFDASKLGFSSGYRGSVRNENIHYSVSGNTITGYYDGILDAYEGLTIRTELPEGYFKGAGYGTLLTNWMLFIIPVLSLLITFLVWRVYGKNDKPVETVEFYPPDRLNSLDVGFIYKGKATQNDVISLLIYLADQGYIKIAEYEKKILFHKSKGFQLTKLKDYSGRNKQEQKFMNGLFTRRRTTVTSADLENSFYITLNAIIKEVNSKDNKARIIESTPFPIRTLIILIMAVSFLTTLGIPMIQFSGIAQLIYVCILLLIYSPFIGIVFFFKMPNIMRVFMGGFITIHALAFLSSTPLFKLFAIAPIYQFSFIYGVICLIIMGYFIKHINRRTPYGNDMLGKIRGFKHFLETAEKERLEMLVMEDPAYFYHILPYTYVLGISNKWIKKFETIALQAPAWYDSPTHFDSGSFHSFMSHTMSSAQRSMASSPSSSDSGGSSGSSSSGGGSSGGGSGGGGGGSW